MSTRTIKRYKGLLAAQAERHAMDERIIEARTKALRKSWGDPGSKVTRKTAAFVWSSGRGRHVVATVYHDGVLGTRLLGSRTEYFTLLADVHRNAVMQVAANKRAAKRKAKGYK